MFLKCYTLTMKNKINKYIKGNQEIKVTIKPYKTGYKYKIKEHRTYGYNKKRNQNSISFSLLINRLENRGFKALW